MKISINNKIKDSNLFKKYLFSVDDFRKIKPSFNLSLKTTLLGIASAIRDAAKNKSGIASDLKNKLLLRNYNLSIDNRFHYLTDNG